MSDKTTIRLLRAFFQNFRPTMFLTGFFQTPPENFYNSESIEIDIQRSGEEMAIVVEGISAGYRDNVADIYTNKRFTAPVFKEKAPLNAYQLLDRIPGENPFENPNFQANASNRAMLLMGLMANKIMRAIEFQAASVLQTGILTYVDGSGNTLFTMDFSPKATHFPTVSTNWSDPAATPLIDLASLADEIRKDSGAEPVDIILGKTAFQNFIRNPEVQALLDNRRQDIGRIGVPERRGQGASFHGTISALDYTFNIWTYNRFYNDVQSGNKVPYVEADKVIMLSENARLDATFGAIPRFAAPEARVLPYIPQTVGGPERGAFFDTFAYLNDDASALNVAVAARPLLIPTDIDSFGCLDTVI